MFIKAIPDQQYAYGYSMQMPGQILGGEFYLFASWGYAAFGKSPAGQRAELLDFIYSGFALRPTGKLSPPLVLDSRRKDVEADVDAEIRQPPDQGVTEYLAAISPVEKPADKKFGSAALGYSLPKTGLRSTRSSFPPGMREPKKKRPPP
jgi:hypothetical protein